MIFLAKALVLLRSALASGIGVRKMLRLLVEYAPLISAVVQLFRKEKPPAEPVKEEEKK